MAEVNRSDLLFFPVLSDNFVNWAVGKRLKKKMAYRSVIIDFQQAADEFETSWLIPNTMPECPE